MGTLIAMRCDLAGGLADHTYVKCSTGNVAWGCFGEKTGGSPLRNGDGSTKRADRIAGPSENGNLNCYLINGVCHQAANRILFPAGVTVSGASGYNISRSLFGTYGRTNGLFGSCKSPFNQYSDVDGDLPECVTGVMESADVSYSEGRELLGPVVSQIEQDDIQGEIELYEQANWEWSEELGIKLFTHMIESHLGWGVTENLNSGEYETLFGLKPGDMITLADPDIISPPSSDKSIDQEEDMPRGPTHG